LAYEHSLAERPFLALGGRVEGEQSEAKHEYAFSGVQPSP
jgi:hypothetical protein